MKDFCLEEGILQSYCDGELKSAELEHVVAHLASCKACAELTKEVESEIELATTALSHEMALGVPTARLRARIDEAITGLDPQIASGEGHIGTRFRGWLDSIRSSFKLAPQGAYGFAGIALVFVLAAVIAGIVMRRTASQPATSLAGISNVRSGLAFPENLTNPAPFVPVVAKPEPRVNRGRLTTGGTIDAAALRRPEALPGEKSYLRAISVLTEAIDVNGESSLQPTLLADYKRNLGVVDEAITVSQRTARSNPDSTDAAEMLYAAYQSKLDLLSAVAEQSGQLVAQR